MNDDSHSNSPPTEPVRVNTALRAGTRGFTESELLEELVKTPETSPMLMPVDQRRAESGDRASEYSSWGSSPARVSSTGSSPRMFRLSLDNSPNSTRGALSSPPQIRVSRDSGPSSRFMAPYNFTSLSEILSSSEDEPERNVMIRGRRGRGRRGGRSRNESDAITHSRLLRASSALQDVQSADYPGQGEEIEVGTGTQDTMDGHTVMPSVTISSIGEDEEGEGEAENEHRYAEP